MISDTARTAGLTLIFLCLESCTKAEFYTSIAQMESLVETEQIIIKVLDEYVRNEEKRIADLKSRLQVYKIENEKAMEDIPNYLGNPINAFTLMKRLTTDLDDIEDSIRMGIDINSITANYGDVVLPTLEDLTGAAQALMRLQTTYQLDVRDLSEGILNGVQHSHRMTAADCFELARTIYNVKDFENTIAWSMEALRKYRTENNIGHTLTESDILEYIIYSHYFIGDVRSSLEWTNKLLELDPNHPLARGNIPHFEKTIKEQEIRKEKKQRRDDEEKKSQRKPSEDYSAKYEALCRGEVDVPNEVAKRLSCLFLTEHHPFLRLAPIKVEQMYTNPDIYMYHQVISDKEIEFIKDMSLPRFERAEVQDPKTGDAAKVLYRIGQSAWMHDSESDVIARLSQRVEDMTGLSVRSSEMLQVANYGIGGYYELHYDSGEDYSSTFDATTGNRIATVMFYMSEVALGGATVFTDLGLSVFPIKHSALFWMNLHPSGNGDMATFHAACPVLKGSKWVGNKWLHQGGQEFLKPCNLDYRDEGTRNILQGIPKTSSWLHRSSTADKSHPVDGQGISLQTNSNPGVTDQMHQTQSVITSRSM